MAFRPPIKGIGSTTPPSPNASVCRRDTRAFDIAPSRSFPLQLSSVACCRPLGAVLEPLADLREGRHVNLRRTRPGEDAGDIEVGDGEAVSEQVRAVCEGAVEHFEGCGERLFGSV